MRPVSGRAGLQGRTGAARVVKEVQEMHGHHQFADSNRQAAELRAFPPTISFSEITQRSRLVPA